MNLEYLISKNKAAQFAAKGIETDEDLMRYMPKTYYDFRQPSSLNTGATLSDVPVLIIGRITDVKTMHGGAVRASLRTPNGQFCSIIWFNQPYMYKKVLGMMANDVGVCGKVSYNETYNNYSIVSPLYFTENISEVQRMIPVYKKIPGVSDAFLQSTINDVLNKFNIKDYTTPAIRKEFKLCDYSVLWRKIHQPQNEADVSAAQRRLIFDDMFYFATRLEMESAGNRETKYHLYKSELMEKVIRSLPYELTEDQMNTVKNITKQTLDERVNALVQGDVGSGKTIVAVLLMVACAENGYQSVLMAPTQILAAQHYENISNIVKPFGIEVVLLKNGMKTKEKKEVLSKISSGVAQIIVGTHSVISGSVVYSDLGLVITDEEHKFGVVQRESLTNKTKNGVHAVTMSATPIPRTLAKNLYGGGKSIYTIKQMPKGRIPVKTVILDDEKRIYNGILQQVRQGRQCYVVCPLITENEDKMEGVESVEKCAERMQKYFSVFSEVKIAVLTGKTPASELSEISDKFSRNEYNVLISTTVIEVGVNVPNASMIVIRNAEKFGLAQLHQLRGRVGRGSYASYCILQSSRQNEERLLTMCSTNDGFAIAREDLKQRGAGDFIGTAQSGDNRYVALMLLYPEFYEKVRSKVSELVSNTCMLNSVL